MKNIETNQIRKKSKRRILCKPPKYLRVFSACLMTTLVIFCAFTYGEDIVNGIQEIGTRRELRSKLCSESEDSGCPKPESDPLLVVLLLLGSLYLFAGIAAVADEFFVPSLEQIGEDWDISDDVAGATLMAAGGSAPELATSLIGTFQGSDVGFGTIVGSAVFNVLFVIACCVIWTPKDLAPLKLTGWPLGRDCTYYCMTLLFVAIFFGVNTPGIIEGWEAAFLFLLYIGYCVLMYFNEYLHLRFTGTKISDSMETDGNSDNHVDDSSSHRMHRGSLHLATRYRAGFYALLTQQGSVIDSTGLGLVFKVKGDVRAAFDQFDLDKSGKIDAHELKNLLTKLQAEHNSNDITDDTVAEVMKELDLDNNGEIDFSEFTIWYAKSEQRLQNEEKKVFDEFDTEQTGSIQITQLGPLLNRLQAHYTQAQLDEAIKNFSDNEANFGKISWRDFHTWYENSGFWKEKLHDAEIAAAEAEGIWGDLLEFPKDTVQGNIVYIIMAPITWTLGLTAGIKDVRVPGNEGWAYYQFLVSIFWIGAYAYGLVEWITTVGATLQIPPVVMGLTILAAGTSVPDLLSSVVVAQAGKGDMAVSSSIGSNIFDVTVGLPVPWILFNLAFDCPVTVGADNLFISVIVLFVMVLLVVVTIMLSDWKMSYGLGATMMVFYVIFVVQDILRVYLTTNTAC